MRFTIPLLLLAITTCSGVQDPFGVVTETPSVAIEDLLASPEELQVGEQTITGDAYVWRDFMPSDRPNSGLRSLVHVLTNDSTPLPSQIGVTRMWVVNDSVAWETSSFEGNRPTQPPYQIEEYAINGPAWPTGTLVDVILRVQGVSGSSVLLLIPQVSIVRTD